MKQVPHLSYRLLEGNEIARFHHLACDLIGIGFPEAYFQGSNSYGALTPQGELVGGFLLRSDGPYRTLASIPNGYTIQVPADFLTSRLAEINAVCLTESHRTGRALIGLLDTLADTLEAGGFKYGLFAVDLQSPDLIRTYRRCGSFPIYQGVTHQLPGMTGPGLETIEALKVDTFLANFKSRYIPCRRSRLESARYHESKRFTKATRRAV